MAHKVSPGRKNQTVKVQVNNGKGEIPVEIRNKKSVYSSVVTDDMRSQQKAGYVTLSQHDALPEGHEFGVVFDAQAVIENEKKRIQIETSGTKGSTNAIEKGKASLDDATANQKKNPATDNSEVELTTKNGPEAQPGNLDNNRQPITIHNEQDLHSMKKDELQLICQTLRLPDTGSKNQLIEAIIAAEQKAVKSNQV